jgi:serine/threonine-protein kinase
MAIEATVGARVGDYILVKKLGEGGMAEVWLARHTVTAQLRAIKFLNKQFQGIPEVEARFQTEGESQLVHPNIVRIYEVGQFEGSSYLVMDFIDGRDLEKILDSRRGPLTVPEAVDISMQILSGLGFAHQSGIVHRDIKPSNVLVDSEGQAYLMDFGIAKALRNTRSVTQVNSRLGTPDYMSPEQIRNPRDVDRRSDIYSFGCMFYELLTGWPPFDRGAGYETEHDIKTAHVSALPTPPVERKAGLPAPLNDIALHCLAKSKEDRPQSCEEILGELEAYRNSVLRGQQPARNATVLDNAPVTNPGTGYGASYAPVSSPGLSPDRRETVVVSPQSEPHTPQPPPQSQPGLAYGGQSRTPTVTDGAILAQSNMVAQSAGIEATQPLNLPPVPQYVPTKVQPADSSQTPKKNRTLVMAVGSILLLGALGGGGYMIFHKEPIQEIKPPIPIPGPTPGPTPSPVTPPPIPGPVTKIPDKKLLVVGDAPAGSETQLPPGTVRWQRVRVSHKAMPDCANLAKDKPVLYATRSDVSLIVMQHPELAKYASGTDVEPLSPDIIARCGGGAYDAVLVLANAPAPPIRASGTLSWTGDPSALGKHITIIRSANAAMPGGIVSGKMFPAKAVEVTVRPFGAATIIAPSAKTNFNTLELFLPNPGQQTILLDWKELP